MDSGEPQRPSEITPLLNSNNGLDGPAAQTLPPIHPTVEHVQNLRARDVQFSQLCPHDLRSPAAETAFALVVLLQWRLNQLRKHAYPQDAWERWSKEKDDVRVAEDLEHQILGLWTEFLEEYRSPQEIEDVLWLGFPDKEEGVRIVRGVCFIRPSQHLSKS
jgi:hypothetical protein